MRVAERLIECARNSRNATGSSGPVVDEVRRSTASDESVIASLDAERVGRALAELPDDQRVVIEMAFIDGDSHSEIAERLDLPLGTVKGRVRGGLKKLGGRLGAGHDV